MEQLSLLLKVFWAPAEAMTSVARKPRVLPPLVVLFVASLAATAVTFWRLDPGELAVRPFDRLGIALTPEQRAQMIETAHEPVRFTVGFIAAALRPVTIVLAASAAYFLIFAVFSGPIEFKAFVAVTAFAFMPALLTDVVTIATLFIAPQSTIQPEILGAVGPAVFVNQNLVSRATFVGFTMIDLVTFWILALLAIGYGVLSGKAAPAVRAVAVIAPWAVYCGLRIVLAAYAGV